MVKISTFEDWIDYFRQWQQDIGYDPALLGNYNLKPSWANYTPLRSNSATLKVRRNGNGSRRFPINPYAMP